MRRVGAVRVLSPSERKTTVDIAYVALTFVLLGLTFGLIQLCDRV